MVGTAPEPQAAAAPPRTPQEAAGALVEGPEDVDGPEGGRGVVERGVYDVAKHRDNPMALGLNRLVDGLDPIGDSPAARNELGENAMATLEYYYGRDVPPWVVLAYTATVTAGTIGVHYVQVATGRRAAKRASVRPRVSFDELTR